jgi:hypothetical protein
MGRKFILIRFGSQGLGFCGNSSDEEAGRESSGGRIQRDGFAFQVKDREMSGSGREVNFVVGCRTGGIVPGLEPFEADEREPAVGLKEFRLVLLAPDSVLFCQEVSCETAGAGSRANRRAMKIRQAERFLKRMRKVYRGREKAGNEGRGRKNA